MKQDSEELMLTKAIIDGDKSSFNGRESFSVAVLRSSRARPLTRRQGA
ncbi:MAG TPA: hypothetical protein P5293_06975 [Bacteroidales bacterium]|nr:hypothetical protein [Bacteroidales bacterium]